MILAEELLQEAEEQLQTPTGTNAAIPSYCRAVPVAGKAHGKATPREEPKGWEPAGLEITSF